VPCPRRFNDWVADATSCFPSRSQLSDSDSDSVASSGSSSSSSSDGPLPARHLFPALTELVQTLLSTHRPSGLFPKLNTTAPQDAQWILPLPQPLKCSTAEDVFMVLKASGLMNGVVESSLLAGRPAEERGGVAHEADGETEGEISIDGVVEDLSDAELAGERVELVLKKWYDMDRSREFRLFVRGDVLLGAWARFPLCSVRLARSRLTLSPLASQASRRGTPIITPTCLRPTSSPRSGTRSRAFLTRRSAPSSPEAPTVRIT
jgi:hypothetical protein